MVPTRHSGALAGCRGLHFAAEESLHSRELFSMCIHSSYALSGYRGDRRFSIYVPEELAPDVQTAVENGRQLQELMKEAGLRYVRARKSERRPRSRQ